MTHSCFIILFCKIIIKYVGLTWISCPHLSPTNLIVILQNRKIKGP